VSLDTFYVGGLKGVGAVWQLTAVDVATRTAVAQLVIGEKTAAVAAGFLEHLRKSLRRLGIAMTGILSDNGPEFTGKDFTKKVTEMGLTHHRIPPRSPNHNAVCEPFHGTVLSEFLRPHFRRGRVDEIALPDRSLQAWIRDCNQHRPNHGDYMRGRSAIVRLASQEMRARYREYPDPDRRLDEPFTLLQLQRLHEAVAGTGFVKDTFRRSMQERLLPTEEVSAGSVGKPARLWRHSTTQGFSE
jgi:hypothetical protein